MHFQDTKFVARKPITGADLSRATPAEQARLELLASLRPCADNELLAMLRVCEARERNGRGETHAVALILGAIELVEQRAAEAIR